MKSEREGCLLNKVGRRRVNVTKRKSQALGACVRWTDSESAGDKNTRPAGHVNAAKLSSTACVLSRRGCFHKAGRTSGLPLPPISGSTAKADPAPARRREPAEPQTSPGSVVTGKSTFVGQGRAVLLKSEPCNKIHVVVGAGTKASMAAARQPRDASPPARPKNGVSGPGSKHAGGGPEAGLTDPQQQRAFCSADSAAETESESSAGKDGRRTPKDGGDHEYYNEQRIGQWILKVNSCLFSKELTEATRAREHDVATIKITYSGE